MNTKTKTILGMILFVVFLIIAYFAYASLTTNYHQPKDVQVTETPTKQAAKRQPAPNFTVFDANGNKVNLSDFTGKPIVLNFWASWCPPCKSEMPHFNKVYADVKADVVFMMVDLVDGQRETQEKGQKYVQDQGYTFPIYFDTEHQGSNTYGISSIPTTLFIDSVGNIAAAYKGAIDEKTLLAGIKAITQ